MDGVLVVGGGLAGVEAAWRLAENGIETELYEMKPKKFSPAHHMPTLAELVCSNSLKAKRLEFFVAALFFCCAYLLVELIVQVIQPEREDNEGDAHQATSCRE